MQRACVPELEHMKTWHPDPDIRGLWGGQSEKNFSALQASVWSKNKRGRGGGTVYELSVVDARLSPRLNTFSFHGG